MDNKYDSPGQVCAGVEAVCGVLAGHRGLLSQLQTLQSRLQGALGLPAAAGVTVDATGQSNSTTTEVGQLAAHRAASMSGLHSTTDIAAAVSAGSPMTPVPTAALLPPVPQLARGAVLPPNRPFLAVVGDQRTGVNVEAPLDTIRQAVSGETESQTAAIVAGLEASIGVQREILEAVQGIELGDEAIGRAVSRYDRQNAIMNGGEGL